MAKPASLFLEKATEYQKAYTSIVDHYIVYQPYGLDDSPEYDSQLKNVETLELKVKMLIAEFDKGETLLERLKAIDSDKSLKYSKERLLSYMEVLELFIEHLNTFRL